MDPTNPAAFNHRYEKINKIVLHFVDHGNPTAPLIILVHGFPDFWYGWRYQVPFLTSLGFRVIVPDVRGYGESDSLKVVPGDRHALDFFTWKSVCGDLAALIDFLDNEPVRKRALNIQNGKGKAIFLGHDWGGVIVYRMAMHHPDRVRAVISLSTAYYPPLTTHMPLTTIVKYNPQFKYQLWFAADYGTAEFVNANIEAFVDSIFVPALTDPSYAGKGFFTADSIESAVFGDGTTLPSVFETAQERKYYVDTFKRTGMEGGFNYYKTRHHNYIDEMKLSPFIKHPVLFIAGTDDAALPPSMAKNMPKYISDLHMEKVRGGHWIQVERRKEVNSMITDWLASKALLPEIFEKKAGKKAGGAKL
ncbi:Alpha/Beta hydrolase protein [Cladochytrium replicatum]|nr:Alpha/Beta hydrolase protein [Cladochytrium replicatum]